MANKDSKIYNNILWFNNRIKYEIDFFDFLQPQRKVSEHPRYKSGLFYSEKCQREIQYESGMELGFIRQLEQLENVKFYYEQPVQIQYRRGKKKQTYTPDFGIYLQSREFVLAEIKDVPSMLDDRVQTRTEALLDFCAGKGFGFLLTDGMNTIDYLLKIKNNRKLEKEILSAVEETTLRKKQCNEIMKRCNATQNQLLKIILRHNLKFKSFPFKLQYGNKNEIFRQVFYQKRKYDDIINEKILTNPFFPANIENK